MYHEKSNNEFLIGATLGCVVGAATALLFTPLSGRNLRKNIMHEMKKRQHDVNGFFSHYHHPHRSMKKRHKKPVMRSKRARAKV